MAYQIGSFNMYMFSFQSDDKIRKDMEHICEMIRDNFDIVAIQEIFNPGALTDRLLKYLGTNEWEGYWAQPRSKSVSAAEGYAFIWRKSKFMLLRKKNKITGEIEKVEPVILDNYHLDSGKQRLLRDPLYGRFVPRNGPFFELRLFNTHIRFSADEKHENEEDSDQNNSVGAIIARKNEFETLIRNVCDKYGINRDGSNRPAYAILLGDYNLNLKHGDNPYPYLEEIVPVFDGKTERRYKTVQNEKTTLRTVEKAEESG